MADEKFIKFLEENSKIVETWPKWKRELLGPYPKNIHDTETKTEQMHSCYPNGDIKYYKNDGLKMILHRDDGPAVIRKNGEKEYWINGIKVDTQNIQKAVGEMQKHILAKAGYGENIESDTSNVFEVNEVKPKDRFDLLDFD